MSAGKGHAGGSLSIVEILVSLFYSGSLRFDSSDPGTVNRDRFILSKGHAGIALYAVLADLGFFSKDELKTFNRGGMLGEHPHRDIPGVEVSSGSLGHGLSVGAGLALAHKLDGRDSRVYVLMGDGECYEGSVWEAAMFASQHCVSNLCAIINRNH